MEKEAQESPPNPKHEQIQDEKIQKEQTREIPKKDVADSSKHQSGEHRGLGHDLQVIHGAKGATAVIYRKHGKDNCPDNWHNEVKRRGKVKPCPSRVETLAQFYGQAQLSGLVESNVG
jgi:hypothetical protein